MKVDTYWSAVLREETSWYMTENYRFTVLYFTVRSHYITLYYITMIFQNGFLLITNSMHFFVHLFTYFISLHVSSIKC